MKRTAAALSAVLVTAAVLAVSGPPAHATMSQATVLPQTSWAYLDSHSPRTKFVNPETAPRAGTIADADGTAHTYRSYFTYDLTPLKGQVVHNAHLSVLEDLVKNCDTAATVELWRTAPVKDATTWKNPPAELERLGQVTAGAPGLFGCPGAFGIDPVGALAAAVARHDKTLTIELRITAAQESDPHAGRTVRQPRLDVTGNHPPETGNPRVSPGDRPCGTHARPTPVGYIFQPRVDVVDADQDWTTVSYEVWPVDHPDQRTVYQWYQIYLDATKYAEGAVLAWHAQAKDAYDTGAWSKTCYVLVDRVSPAKAPLVTSKVYPEGEVQGGGPGVKARFRFDADGDTDVATFSWHDQSGQRGDLKANRPGGSAVLEYTPAHSGRQLLSVQPVDRAGNAGPQMDYWFSVAPTAPTARVAMGGIGLPSRLDLTATTASTTGFGYQVGDGAETRLPAVDGKASVEITFTQVGNVTVTVSSYAGDKLLGRESVRVYASDAPAVDSAEFGPFVDALLGAAGSFTFKPRSTGVTRYDYCLSSSCGQVAAGADGSAVLPWTAQSTGYFFLNVTAVRADNSRSNLTTYSFRVLNPTPRASAPSLSLPDRVDGVGVPLEIQLSSELSNVTGFAYRFDGGAEVVVPEGDVGYPYTPITVTPTHTGNTELLFEAVLADGKRSPTELFTFSPYTGPVVTTDPAQGAAGQPMTLTFRSVLPNTAWFAYSLPGAEDQSVAAGADGTATVTYTPPSHGFVTATVVGYDSADAPSPVRRVQFYVRDTSVQVVSGYNPYWPIGGAGAQAAFGFATAWQPEVVEYRYRLNEGPEQSVPAEPSGYTYTRVTLDRSGANTLTVQGRTASGALSTATAYAFLVGTAPEIFSAEYPGNLVPAGGVGVEGHFTFSGGTAGITSFEYFIDDATPATVQADAEGRATVSWTPQTPGTHVLVVTGHLADGTPTDRAYYYLSVAS
ncbi:hypothetical protein [Dactylosporangium sp. NPDC048998]|uniref:hypothetical protein n=1 Tax=Dactylosporangium sp. NPDC048998 TaxID=3363976 RepID=UPI00371BFAED